MPACISDSYPSSQAGPRAPGMAPASASAAAMPTVHSQDLLQGHKTVTITHNGTLYRLQATRLGKLILTK